ncbi:MAG: serine protease [Candidatus Obscuribacterales bacterium]|nr:serine protease [Candidatus Obscuribacterales bacterium]
MDNPTTPLASNKAADASQKLFEETRPSVFKIETDRGGGTGWLVDENTVVTSYHVIQNSRKIAAIGQDGKRYPLGAEIIFDAANDIAILKFQGQPPPQARALAVGAAAALKPGDKVVSMGHPGGSALQTYEGSFEKMATWRDWLVLQEKHAHHDYNKRRFSEHQKYLSPEILNRPLVEVRLTTERGCSGGPVMNADGKVVAIVTQGSTHSNQFGYNIPAEKLSAMLNQRHNPTGYEQRAGHYEPGIVTQFRKVEHDPLGYVVENGALLLGAWAASPLAHFNRDPMSLITRDMALKRSLIGAGVLGALSWNDSDGLMRSTNHRDTLKFSLALTSDATMAAGFASKYMSVLRSTGVDRAGRVGKVLMLAGAGARLACELIPNSFVVDVGNAETPGR